MADVMERIRLTIAGVLDRRDDVCWGRAEIWALFHDEPIGVVFDTAECRSDPGPCWCGKFCDGRRSVPADFEGDGEDTTNRDGLC